MKVPIILKIIATILLLQSIFILALVIFGNVTAIGISKGLTALIFTVFGVAELVSSIGLFMSKKAAVYATSIISVIGILTNISNLIGKQEKDLWAVIFVIIFGIAIYLTVNCIIQNRKQAP